MYMINHYNTRSIRDRDRESKVYLMRGNKFSDALESKKRKRKRKKFKIWQKKV